MNRKIYSSLDIINKYANEYKDSISDLITVKVPFYNSPIDEDGYKFIIYDTPGSSSESNREHFDILQRALGEQTNGLPIIVTSPDTMDATGLNELLNALREIDGKLDLTNVMITINKADDKSDKTLKSITVDAETKLANWKSNRLYVLSAVMGLGSKKQDYNHEDSWVDDDYLECFLKNIDSFVNNGARTYKQLYLHNQIAGNRKRKYIESVKDVKDERELLYINSGLHCIEQEIVEFARKYALYNKCSQAQDYLEEAIQYIKTRIDSLKKEKEEIERELCIKQDTEKQVLLGKLKNCISDSKKEIRQEYPSYMKKYTAIELPKRKKELEEMITETWSSVSKSKKKEKIDSFLKQMRIGYAKKRGETEAEFISYSEQYWSGSKKKLQEECCKIVMADENLTAEEQGFLQQFIMNLGISIEPIEILNISSKEIRDYFINFWGIKFIKLDWVDTKKAVKLYSDYLEKHSRKKLVQIEDGHTKGFHKWIDALENGMVQEMANLNPSLRELAKELKKQQKVINDIQIQQDFIMGEQQNIKNMFELKEREVLQ